MEKDLMARLAKHRAIGHAPASEHAWFVSHGVLRTFPVGAVVTAKGEESTGAMIVLEGHMVIRMDRGAGSHKIFEWRGGDVGGRLPYSRRASPPNDVIAEEHTEVLAIDGELLSEVIRECPVITAAFVHAMLDRARMFTTSDLRDEKLVSLGKLSAGLAHELNNPASAVVRSARILTHALSKVESAAQQLAESQLTASQFAAIESALELCIASQTAMMQTSIAHADREDTIIEWLADHDADEESAIPLADTAISISDLDDLAAVVSGKGLDAGLQWLAACCVVRSLSAEIETAATRIHELVSAVKGFSYMDHAPTTEPVDIRRGISDAFTMLGAKTKAKSAEIALNLPDDLPRVHAVGAELNQVWLNLIDNALDAIEAGGHVSVRAARELNCVVVHVVDDGPGIPAEIKSRIFDPFFTTKGVGQGSGLGLDIVRRLLQRHEGEVSVESVPGRTAFQVRLPIAG